MSPLFVHGLMQFVTSYHADGEMANQVQRTYNGFQQLIIEYQAHTGLVSQLKGTGVIDPQTDRTLSDIRSRKRGQNYLTNSSDPFSPSIRRRKCCVLRRRKVVGTRVWPGSREKLT